MKRKLLKGDELSLEYAPGMYRKVTVEYVGTRFSRAQGKDVPVVRVSRIDSTFYLDTGEEVVWKHFRRKIMAFDPIKIEVTKMERKRRKIAAAILKIDWMTMPIGTLKEVARIVKLEGNE
jgi:hypothetical protein